MGEAYGARTVEKLDGLLADLPNERGRDAGAATPAPGRSGRTFPGLSPFTTRAEFDVTPERVHSAVLESLAPALNKYGYELRHRSPTSLVFERRGRPRWVPFVAVFTFPVGLVALAVHETRRIVIATDELEGPKTAVTVYGTAPRAIRRAFTELGS